MSGEGSHCGVGEMKRSEREIWRGRIRAEEARSKVMREIYDGLNRDTCSTIAES